VKGAWGPSGQVVIEKTISHTAIQTGTQGKESCGYQGCKAPGGCARKIIQPCKKQRKKRFQVRAVVQKVRAVSLGKTGQACEVPAGESWESN
jgi:hypothetical protein